MTLSLIGDTLVAVLLVATIFYSATLNRRLGALRGDKVKLEELIHGLTASSMRAEAGVQGLKQAAEEIGKELEKKVAASRTLKDDLTYLVDRGGTLADRLEGAIRTRRDEPRGPAGRPESRPEPRIVEAPELSGIRRGAGDKILPLRLEAADEPIVSRVAQPSRAERELLRALAGRR